MFLIKNITPVAKKDRCYKITLHFANVSFRVTLPCNGQPFQMKEKSTSFPSYWLTFLWPASPSSSLEVASDRELEASVCNGLYLWVPISLC